MIQEAHENKVKICKYAYICSYIKNMLSFVKINSFLSYIFPVLEFLNFGDLRVEFLVSSFLSKDV